MAEVFAGRNVLITGGSSGIGAACAELLAERGANVWILARDQARLTEALAKIRARARSDEQKLGWLSADVSDYAQVEAALAQMVAAVGPPYLTLCSAGVFRGGYFDELPLDDFRRLMDVNYLGAVHPCRAVYPHLKAARRGRLALVSSVAGLVGLPGYSAYTSTKFAVTGLGDALRAELKPYGVGVSVIFPPDVDTPQLRGEIPQRTPELAAISAHGRVLTAA